MRSVVQDDAITARCMCVVMIQFAVSSIAGKDVKYLSILMLTLLASHFYSVLRGSVLFLYDTLQLQIAGHH